MSKCYDVQYFGSCLCLEGAVLKDLCITLCFLSISLCNFYFTITQRFTEMSQSPPRRTQRNTSMKIGIEPASCIRFIKCTNVYIIK